MKDPIYKIVSYKEYFKGFNKQEMDIMVKMLSGIKRK